MMFLEKPLRTCASGCSIARRRYSSSARTVEPSERVTCDPTRPLNVGPARSLPLVEWHDVQPRSLASNSPAWTTGSELLMLGAEPGDPHAASPTLPATIAATAKYWTRMVFCLLVFDP